MSSLAILIGVANYRNLSHLACCPTDVEAMKNLVEATGRFDAVHTIIDSDAASLKDTMRALLKPGVEHQQIFFYFSGHGHSDNGDFYFCLSDFTDRRPNETGLSQRDLHALLREASPDMVVKVIDACSSGSLLIKSGENFLPNDKGGLNNLVQIASCLDSQTSLTGDPLSEFTEKFCLASSRKEAGPLYYTDIISALRDDYLQDKERSPHFVFQASARETFVDDAAQLSQFRDNFASTWASKVSPAVALIANAEANIADKAPTLAELLGQMENKVAKPQDVSALIGVIFDGIQEKMSEEAFKDFFTLGVVEHSDFNEPETRGFVIRVLSQEKRNDDFVTAAIKRERKAQSGLMRLTAPLAYALQGEEAYTEHYELRLNMRLDRAQMRLTFTPKYKALQQVNLFITCAPSMESCYLFELATRHPRTDWDSFASEGVEVTRRWYKLSWRQSVDSIIDKITDQMSSVIKQHLEAIGERLAKE